MAVVQRCIPRPCCSSRLSWHRVLPSPSLSRSPSRLRPALPRSSSRSSSDKPVLSTEVDSPPSSSPASSENGSSGSSPAVDEQESAGNSAVPESKEPNDVQTWVAAAGSALMASVLVAGLEGRGLQIPDGLVEAATLTFFSEIGDKTFFIALVLAARDPVYRIPVFFGTWGALSTMTVLSTVLGRLVHGADELLPPSFKSLLPIPLDDLFAVLLLLFFGYNTISEALEMDSGDLQDEEEEAREAVSSSRFKLQEITLSAEVQLAIATFSLVFLAEWGDKSQLSTIALASSYSPVGVASGAVLGFLPICLLAVLGGSILGDVVSEKVLSIIAGVIFILVATAIVGNDLVM